jgi:hypothetical protein
MALACLEFSQRCTNVFPPRSCSFNALPAKFADGGAPKEITMDDNWLYRFALTDNGTPLTVDILGGGFDLDHCAMQRIV